jgi:hypothetical protein
MKNKNENSKKPDFGQKISLFFAILYIQSVLTVAHHIALWPADDVSRTAEGPAVGYMILGLGFLVSSYFRKRHISTIGIISLTIFGCATLFWLSGLRANFF